MQSWNAPVVTRLPGLGGPVALRDTLSGERVTLSFDDGIARLYVCGITPYDATHLGHAATYLAFDTLVRAWTDQGLSVHYVQNVTDVDEPLLERAQRDGIDWRDLATREIALYRSDMQGLRVIPPQDLIGAVEAMPLIGRAAAALVDAGAAYPVDEGGVRDYYYSVDGDGSFGELSRLDHEGMAVSLAANGGDPDRAGKHNPLDALVWRGRRPDEPSWSSPLGEGRPGWHVECAAIALDRLGARIDVQGGGRDLVFPHHEYSSSTAKALTGEATFARAHLHVGMIGLDGEKMSKSRGNLVLVSRLREQGVDLRLVRLALLSQHYSLDRSWGDHLLVEADGRLTAWQAASHRASGPSGVALLAQVRAALADDLDTPSALAAIDSWSRETGDDEHAPRLVRDVVLSLLGVDIRPELVGLPPGLSPAAVAVDPVVATASPAARAPARRRRAAQVDLRPDAGARAPEEVPVETAAPVVAADPRDTQTPPTAVPGGQPAPPLPGWGSAARRRVDTTSLRQVSPLLPALRRFWALVLLAGALAAGGTALLSPGADTSYSASATFLVPAASDTAEPGGSPYDAERLAGTYTVVLAQDQQLLQALAGRLGVATSSFKGRLVVVNLSGSSALRVDFDGTSEPQVRTFFTAFSEIVQQTPPVSPNLIPGTLRPLDLPDRIDEQGGHGWVLPVLVGLVGLALGLGAAQFLQRANPRLTDRKLLAATAGAPVVEVPHLRHSGRAQAVVVRLARSVPGGRLAVAGVGRHGAEDAAQLAVRLETATGHLLTQERLPEGFVGARYVPITPAQADADRIIQESVGTVLVTRMGTLLRDLDHALELLEQLGSGPVLVVLLPAVSRFGHRDHRAPVEPAPATAGRAPVGAGGWSVTPERPAQTPSAARGAFGRADPPHEASEHREDWVEPAGDESAPPSREVGSEATPAARVRVPRSRGRGRGTQEP